MSNTRKIVVFRKVLAAVFGVFAAFLTMAIVRTLIVTALRGDPSHMDFVGIWSWARLEIEYPAALIYDHAAQYAFLLSLDPAFPVPMPFPYPPLYLFIIRPLGWMSYPVAEVIWSATTLLAYMVAICAPGWRLRIVLPALLAPACAVNLDFGQNGFLTAALMIGGIRLAPSWPVTGGILLGLLAYKPQFGFLVVIALIAGRLWVTALVAALTVVTAMVASLFAFGLESWTAWARAMPDFVAIVDLYRARLLHLMPTPFANMLALGASDRIAEATQFAVTAAAIAAVWFAFRCAPPTSYPSPSAFGRANGGGTADRTAVLATASVLATPYAFIYDLTLVAAAVAFIVAKHWPTLSAMEVLVLGIAALLPACMFLDIVPPLGAAVHGLLLALILLRCRRAAFRAPAFGVDGFVPAGD